MKFEDDIVLVTGSNGRIGDAVMRRLRRRFDNVVGLDRKAPAPPPPLTAQARATGSAAVARVRFCARRLPALPSSCQ